MFAPAPFVELYLQNDGCLLRSLCGCETGIRFQQQVRDCAVRTRNSENRYASPQHFENLAAVEMRLEMPRLGEQLKIGVHSQQERLPMGDIAGIA